MRIPKEKKIIKIELNEDNTKELENAIEGIKNIVNGSIPKLVKNSHCRNCAYSEFCWA
ncbi:Dna2/Cas4 domain-containing protein [Ferroplasma acidarmanus]|uniref:Dna2/Cas4 domain-containing protein n=1 Tax=Ferroplasma acidarmanus TaxID=97393 RepID=UPI00165146EF